MLSRLFITRRPSVKRVSCPFSSCCICRMAARSCCLLRQLCGDGAATQRGDTAPAPTPLRQPGPSLRHTACPGHGGVLAQELCGIKGPLRYLILFPPPPVYPDAGEFLGYARTP